MSSADPDLPSTWTRFRPSLCDGCRAGCCTLPVEVGAADLLRMGLVTPDETTGSLKKVARRLIRDGVVRSFRARTGLFTLEQRDGGDCIFLGKDDRLCRLYDRRPDVCRRFPEIGPRPGFCPAAPKRREEKRAPSASERRPHPRAN